MQYPKPIMSITELTKLGFPRDDLNCAVRSKGQSFAVSTIKKGKWLIDTEKFEKWRTSRINK